MVSIGMVVVRWGNYMSEWIPKFIIPRPSQMGTLDPYARWLVNPEAPSGTGDTPVEGTAGPYQSLIGPPIINMNDGSLFSIPALSLHFDTEVGGNMEGLVQFWDDDAEIYEQLIATLSCSIPPTRTDTYGLAICSVDWDSDGSFTGDWVALGTPIPAGSGFMHGSGTPGSSGTNIGLTVFPFSIPYGATVIVGVELGDAGGGVLTSVNMSQSTFQAVIDADSTSSAKQLINTVHDISWAAEATQCRCIAAVSGYYGGAQGCSGSAGVGAITIERIDP